ncbi:sigma-70 family RNA polymerase sigma factor [Microlunatus flavus]|uniref:RNA polymerase sigma-B factor n=1 Tax=Microlunatus flavus TaxID=1036181 RepID=A0A1H8ZLF8_9ACTN|nr:sigma-70 family RNA polymerase sigma factor [Microlunatus flavus]SEP65117.1 RNA polymerase sigma-B factor [Microlunatus flavus]
MPLLTLSPAASADASTALRAPDQDQRAELAAHTLALFRESRAADEDRGRAIVDEIVTSHLWLADAVARRFRDRGEEADDLRQIARAGLVEACSRFDPDQGPFTAFAFPTVTGLVKRHFRDHGWSIRPPRPTQELSAEMWRSWPEIAQAVGGEPSERQLAASLGASVDEVRRARSASQAYTCSSLDALAQDRSEDDPEGDRCEARVLVSSVWPELTQAERELLRMRFYEERSQSDIAGVLGTNQMQVSRLLARLMTKLRRLIGSLDEREVPAAA